MQDRSVGVAAGIAAVLAWVVGVALLGLHDRLPSGADLPALAGLGLVLVAAALMRLVRQGHPAPAAATIGIMALGVVLLAHGVAGVRTQWRLEARLPHGLEGVPLLLVGTVAELPRRTAQGVQFVFEVESAQGPDGLTVPGVPQRVWLGWWVPPHAQPLEAASVPEPSPGQRWQLPAVLKRPHGTLNPGGFDAERWFLEQDLGASGSVSASRWAEARLLEHASAAWRDPQAWRAALRRHIDAHVADPRLAGLVAGLTIGDQSAVDAADWQLFRDAGVAHALSISGLHITAFAAMAAPVVAAIWRRWPSAALRWPASLVGAVAGWWVALAYAGLAGWGLPAQRTVAMLGVLTGVRLLGLHWPPMLVWLAAAAPVVVLDPWAVTQAGFWLSFAAVGLLLLSTRDNSRGATGGLRKGIHAAQAAIRTQLNTTVGLAPLAAVCFQQLSVVGVLANLVALPWITAVLTPLCLLGLLWPALWGLLPIVIDPLRAGLAWLVSGPFSVATVPSSGAWVVALGMLGAALCLMNLPLRMRLAGCLLMLPLLLPPPRSPKPGHMEIWALDVGQGSAVLVRTRDHALLMDAGPAWGEGRDAGERVVLPVLRHLGVRHLDRLVVTHRDIDHVGGAAAVLKGIEVRSVLSSLEPSHPLRRFPIPHESCRRGQAWTWDGVDFEVLHPFGDESPRAPPNTISCVLRIQDAQGRSVLVTGDIERDQEMALIHADAQDRRLRSDALLVPHHGSKTSSTEPFLREVQPHWAIAQAGYRNRHGHPAAQVVQRYEALEIPLQSSPWCGAWFWNGAGPPDCWRQRGARLWHDMPP